MTSVVRAVLCGLLLSASSLSWAALSISITPNGGNVASFGVPLPPGHVTDAALVRVLDASGTEIPAYVESLGDWVAIPPSDTLCTGISPTVPGIRSVLVQIAAPTTEATYTVDFSPRTANKTKTPVADTFVPVTSGTFDAADGITEPGAYATLPANWLACSGITPMQTVLGAGTFMAEADQAQVNFWPTTLNLNADNLLDSQLHKYKTEYEPWLYDRAQSYYATYVRTGELKYLREATRATQYYRKNIYDGSECSSGNCRGYFKLKNPSPDKWMDFKYSYNQSLASYYWLTGDASVKSQMADVTAAAKYAQDITQRLTGDANSGNIRRMTERHWAFAFLAVSEEYNVTGDPALLDYLNAGIDAMVWSQQNQPEGNDPKGCFGHYLYGFPDIAAVPWMSSLLAHSFVQAYEITGDQRIPKMIADLATCFTEVAIYEPPNQAADLPDWMPCYEAAPYKAGTPPDSCFDVDQWNDFEHAVDVTHLFALGVYFTQDQAQRAKLLAGIAKIWPGHAHSVKKWERLTSPEGYSKYRVSPPRKFAWQYKNTGSIGWALGERTAFAGAAPVDPVEPPIDPPVSIVTIEKAVYAANTRRLFVRGKCEAGLAVVLYDGDGKLIHARQCNSRDRWIVRKHFQDSPPCAVKADQSMELGAGVKASISSAVVGVACD